MCAFPYVLAFTQDTIEIRLIINGNLVHTMTMPELGLITSKVSFTYSKFRFLFNGNTSLIFCTVSADLHFELFF